MELVEVFNSYGYPIAISIVFFIWLFRLVNKQVDKSDTTQEKLIKTLENTIVQQNESQVETTKINKSVSEALLEFSKSQSKLSDALLEFSKSQSKFSDALLQFSKKVA